ncbi:MAG: PilZ domain-containing protein [Candidatus Anstonellales archaeon]
MAYDVIKKIYIDENNTGTIICDECGRNKKIIVKHDDINGKNYLITCQCGNTFKVIFEFRKSYRKTTNLRGTFKTTDKEYPMIIKDISYNGIGIWSPFSNKLSENSTIEVNFTLDNSNRTVINRYAIVKYINGNRAGLEFIKDRKYDKDISFYLIN